MTHKESVQKLKQYEIILTPLQEKLIELLKNLGPVKRNNLVNELNLPRSTIYDNLLELKRLDIVEKKYLKRGKPGRPPVIWMLKPN